MRSFLPSLFVLVGCPYVGVQRYQEQVQDADGDGVIDARFGGPDCDDHDPTIGDCDADGDGVRALGFGDDCDDTDPSVHPDAEERCDGLDNDCDGFVDNVPQDPAIAREAGATPLYPDADGDGIGAMVPIWDCAEQRPGHLSTGGDCDDTDATIYPGAPELCDAVDHNCDGDPFYGASDGTPYYLDADGDGFGTTSSSGDLPPIVKACEAPAGYVIEPGDCDDADPTISPGEEERCDGIDNDCDGVIDLDVPTSMGGLALRYRDQDGDGFGTGEPILVCATLPGWASIGGDCDDGRDDTYPGAPEICDDPIRQDCSTFDPFDCDEDGHVDAAQPGGTDCDDADPLVHPDADEICNGVDDDCDGAVDEDPTDGVLVYEDRDGDGFGDRPVLACDSSPGTVPIDGDCDDADPTAYPGAPEICGDAVRQDCSEIDPYDCDADGHVDVAQPGGTDCDDANPLVHPDADEICNGIDDDCDGLTDSADDDVIGTGVEYFADDDGDGFGGATSLGQSCDAPPGGVPNSDDCDDTDGGVHPGAPEACNDRDDDCDGAVDEEPTVDVPVFYVDGDGDGFGDPAAPITDRCDAPGNAVSNDDDCHDGDADIRPTATEVCNGRDDDCDGLTDDADPSNVSASWYLDNDGDGFGQSFAVLQQCAQPAGYTPLAGDCDDNDPLVQTERVWFRDADGDGVGNSAETVHQCLPPAGYVAVDGDCDDGDPRYHDPDTPYYFDGDGDGSGDPAVVQSACGPPSGYTAFASDCDDADPAVNPLAVEVCNGVDDDCDGDLDDADPSVVVTSAWYADDDGDGVGGDRAYDGPPTCTAPAGHVTLTGDCDDTDASVQWSTLWGRDADNDGFGDEAQSQYACNAPAGHVNQLGDCDDTNAAINPLAVEICNGVDDDCDGDLDDADPSVIVTSTWYVDADGDGMGGSLLYDGPPSCAVPDGHAASSGDCDDADPTVQLLTTWYADADGDGSGNAGSTLLACSQPQGHVATAGDCDDADPAVQLESLWYADGDGDGYGDETTASYACHAPPGYTDQIGDCNDADPAIHPAAVEQCNGIDDDCDGSVDDADPSVVVTTAWYRDDDGDGVGSALYVGAPSCTAPSGYVAIPGDCDDTDGTVQFEIPWYLDGDGDGHGLDGSTVVACHAPTGYVSGGDDCDDTDPQVSPSAVELCNGVDDDCDGLTDDADPSVLFRATWYLDDDGDGYGQDAQSTVACFQPAGYASASGDCDDADSAINPVQTETCNGIDDDCDGLVDDDDSDTVGLIYAWTDADGDGYGDSNAGGMLTCPGSGLATNGLDCDDADNAVNPAQPERCNGGIDDDCDGLADDEDTNVLGQQIFFRDEDGDGFGDSQITTQACTLPVGHAANDRDCDDTDPDLYYDARTIDDPSQLRPTLEALCDGGRIELQVPALSTPYTFPLQVPARTVNIVGIPNAAGSKPAIGGNQGPVLAVPSEADYRIVGVRLRPVDTDILGDPVTQFVVSTGGRLTLRDVAHKSPTVRMKRLASVSGHLELRDLWWIGVQSENALIEMRSDSTVTLRDVTFDGMDVTSPTTLIEGINVDDLTIVGLWERDRDPDADFSIALRDLPPTTRVLLRRSRFEGGNGVMRIAGGLPWIEDTDFVDNGRRNGATAAKDVIDAGGAAEEAATWLTVVGSTFRRNDGATDVSRAIRLRRGVLVVGESVFANWNTRPIQITTLVDGITGLPQASFGTLRNTVFLDGDTSISNADPVVLQCVLYEDHASGTATLDVDGSTSSSTSWSSEWLAYDPILPAESWLLYPRMDFAQPPPNSTSDLLKNAQCGGDLGLTAHGSNYQQAWLVPYDGPLVEDPGGDATPLDTLPDGWVRFMMEAGSRHTDANGDPLDWPTQTDGDPYDAVMEYGNGTWPIFADP